MVRLSHHAFIFLAFLLCPFASATIALHAPSFSVHESGYGTLQNGKRSESIQKISIHLVRYSQTQNEYVVESFFLKKTKPGEMPQINDTVIFKVTNPHATYEVTARPILLSSTEQSSKSPKKSKKKPKKKSSKKSKSKQKSTTSKSLQCPREGFVVRVLSEGVMLRLHASSHQLEQLVKTHPELFDKAASSKSARHLPAESLLKP